jgi:hypothetical protein
MAPSADQHLIFTDLFGFLDDLIRQHSFPSVRPFRAVSSSPWALNHTQPNQTIAAVSSPLVLCILIIPATARPFGFLYLPHGISIICHPVFRLLLRQVLSPAPNPGCYLGLQPRLFYFALLQ